MKQGGWSQYSTGRCWVEVLGLGARITQGGILRNDLGDNLLKAVPPQLALYVQDDG